MNIEFSQIKGVISEIDPDAKFVGTFQNTYRIASIFEPVDNGFYFIATESTGPLPVHSGLLVMGEIFFDKKMLRGGTGAILTLKDPQYVYYSVLDALFRRKSTGEISHLSQVSPAAKLEVEVEIGPFCDIKDNVTIEKGAIIGSHCVIESGTNIGANTRIDSGCHIGADGVAWVWNEEGTDRVVESQLGGVRIAENCFLGSGSIVVKGSLNEETVVGENTLLAPGCRVGHGSSIGNYVHLANGVLLGGNVLVADFCFVGSGAIFRPRVKVSRDTVVAAGSVVIKDTTREGVVLVGVPAIERERKVSMQGIPRLKRDNVKSRSEDA